MKKFIVLSVNDNPAYLFHVPLVVWAWRYFGWEPVIFWHSDADRQSHSILWLIHENGVAWEDIHWIRNFGFGDYHSDTITQISRLYGCCIPGDNYLMTGDIDMIPLSDYWKPDMDKLTVYGRDLTDYHYPICYIGAPRAMWADIMDLGPFNYNVAIKRDLDQLPQALSTDKTKRWVTDQDLITERINNSNYTPVRIDRGTDKRTGYPIGRIDRSHWTLQHEQYIDAHMFHDVHRNEDSFKKTLNMLHTVFPNEDFKWWLQYVKEFKKLCQKTSQSVH